VADKSESQKQYTQIAQRMIHAYNKNVMASLTKFEI
jgi:hypothetical protein